MLQKVGKTWKLAKKYSQVTFEKAWHPDFSVPWQLDYKMQHSVGSVVVWHSSFTTATSKQVNHERKVQWQNTFPHEELLNMTMKLQWPSKIQSLPCWILLKKPQILLTFSHIKTYYFHFHSKHLIFLTALLPLRQKSKVFRFFSYI